MKEIRAERRMQTAKQGSMVRGGGKIGRVVRAAQRASRDADRRRHAERLAPYEQQKAAIDPRIHDIDTLILAHERRILEIEAEPLRF